MSRCLSVVSIVVIQVFLVLPWAVAAATPSQETFPLASWVVYAVANAPANATLTRLSVQFEVPDSPDNLFGSSSPGFWLGALPRASSEIDITARIVLAWAAYRPQFTVFGELVGLARRGWHQTTSGHVLPGEMVEAELVYNASVNTGGPPTAGYMATLRSQGEIVAEGVLALAPGSEPLADVYLTLENAPASCREMPSCGNLNMRNITLEWSGAEKGAAWSWDVHTPQAACDAALVVHTMNHLEFTWSIGSTTRSHARSGAEREEL